MQTSAAAASSVFSRSFYSSSDFDLLTNEILNELILVVNSGTQQQQQQQQQEHHHQQQEQQRRYRICEVEIYYQDQSSHADPYVHANADQLRFGYFYFHKFPNGSYKAGTFKGVDLTFGQEDQRIYFGVLIRSIENLQTNEFIEGPCRVVNTLLDHFQVSNVREMMNLPLFENRLVPIHHPLLRLVKVSEQSSLSLRRETVYRGPRIGLSEKAPSFQRRHYRYAIKIAKIRKQRKTLIES